MPYTYNYIQPYNQDTITAVMPRVKKGKEDTDYEPFSTTGEDGRVARQLLLKEPLRYFNEFQDCGRPARVVDKLRKAHGRFMKFNRDSLKNGIRKILNEDEIRTHLESYFDNMMKSPNNEDEEQDHDNLVSENGGNGQFDRRRYYNQLHHENCTNLDFDCTNR